jgi:hypothetical protein
VDYVLQGLLDIGYQEVFEVARAAEIVTNIRASISRRSRALPDYQLACPLWFGSSRNGFRTFATT